VGSPEAASLARLEDFSRGVAARVALARRAVSGPNRLDAAGCRHRVEAVEWSVRRACERLLKGSSQGARPALWLPEHLAEGARKDSIRTSPTT